MIRFAADENLNDFIVRGLLRRHPDLDIVRIRDTEMREAGDPALLEWAVAEGRVHFVFCDKLALATVRFHAFVRDCREIERPLDELKRAVEQQRLELADFIHKQHEELQRTFDPSVARLRKRRKILVHKDAFAGLE